MRKEPFVVDVPEAVLVDLQQRLSNVRWAQDFANAGWEYGTNGEYLRTLVEHWRDHYDWRQHERAMNAFPHFRTVIDDVPIHFIHVKGKGPRPAPLILNHGWPSTFWEYYKMIGPLTDPAADGGDPADAFDVVVPSLPGYGFSTPLLKAGLNAWNTPDLWVQLMEGLGYPRFATHGGDWGGILSAQLGHKYASRLIGAHVTLVGPLDGFTGGTVDPADYAPEEQEWLGRTQHFWRNEAGYVALQTSKPQTIAFALNDSPVGLCSWIVEKWRTWSDCGGDVETRFSKDDLLTNVMLYWVTQSYGTSARYYYEALHRPWQPSHNRMPVVEAPTAAAVFAKELFLKPKRWAERYYNLKRWTVFPSGGHFAPLEEPQGLTEDIRTFFRALRT